MRMEPLFQIDKGIVPIAPANCVACGLHKHVFTPNMQMNGEGREGILLIGEGPGSNEDAKGIQFYEGAKAGGRLHRTMCNYGIDVIRDCFTINAVNCRPFTATGNRTPTADEVKHCRPNMLKAIATAKPRAIFLLGAVAIESFLADKSSSIRRTRGGADEKGKASTIAVWRGLRWPDLQHDAWVYPMLHPAYIERVENYAHIFERDIARALEHVRCGFTIPKANYKNDVDILLHVPDIKTFLNSVIDKGWQIAVDFETNMLSPHHNEARLLTAAICQISPQDGGIYKAVAFPVDLLPDAHDREQIRGGLLHVLQSSIPKIYQNFQMEEKWARWLGGPSTNFVFDTMQAAHIIDTRDLYCNLDKQVFLHWGYEYGQDIAKYKHGDPINNMDKAPIKDLLTYNALDALFTAKLSRELIKPLRADPDLMRAYKLWHDGTKAFSVMESVGIPVNVDYFLAKKAELERDMAEANTIVRNTPEVKKFFDKHRRYPDLGAKGGATKDLGLIVSDIIGYEAVDEVELARIPGEFAANIIKLRKSNKLLNTYLAAYLNHYYGRIYPNFNLHLTRTLRSSSDRPNFQNIPNRDAEARALVRRGMCPPSGFKWATTDYGSHEVRIIAAYFNDPELSRMIHADEDPHGEWCVELGLDKQRAWKDARSDTKNAVVFPWFYGSWYRSVHADLVSRGYELSESKVQRTEQLFWTKYAVVRRGQEDLIRGYERTGYVPMLFGHRRNGILSKNQIINAAIQGSAFHCLLWAAIQAIALIEREGLQTRIPGQIHDEIVSFIWPEEEAYYIRTLTRIMEEDVRKFNPRISVPLLAEWAVGAVDAPWLDKKSIPPNEMEAYLERI